jgi:hypothetical protein
MANRDKIIIDITGGDRWDVLGIVAVTMAVLVYF